MGRRRRSDVLTQAILASAPDAVVVLDDGGAVVEFNPAAERMFGVRRDSVIGSELYDGMRLPNSQAERAPLDRSYEATARRSDGATFPAEVSTAPVVGVDARLRVLYVRDIQPVTGWRDVFLANNRLLPRPAPAGTDRDAAPPESVRLRWPPAVVPVPRLVLDDVIDPENAHHHDPARLALAIMHALESEAGIRRRNTGRTASRSA